MVRRPLAALLALTCAALCAGCVERRFRVESNPPGAYVYVNNEPHGPAPVDVPFLYYGDYDIKLQKDGYQTLRVKQPVSTPWYQYPLIDFFAENVWPLQVTDIRPLHYELDPLLQPNIELLKAEGDDFRRRAADLPKPRYPDLDKDKKKKDDGGAKPATEALPPPKEAPGVPAPKPAERK